MTDLLVTYPAGSTAESSTVAAVTRVDGHVLFAVQRTPCHPESPSWPDQPQDRCTLAVGEGAASMPIEVHEGYLAGSELHLGRPPHDETSDPGAETEPIACVVHSLATEHLTALACARGPQATPTVGEEVALRVDESYRAALSRSHSRCHLVSLALNAALADAWRKEPPARDSLGNPDFDKLAIASSKIEEHSSLDCYRIGKHLRKSGFSADVLSDTHGLAEVVADIAKGWLLSSPAISVAPGECALAERRTWSCELPQATASFLCGGTHPSAMEPDDGLEVRISWDPDERRLRMLAQSRTFHL